MPAPILWYAPMFVNEVDESPYSKRYCVADPFGFTLPFNVAVVVRTDVAAFVATIGGPPVVSVGVVKLSVERHVVIVQRVERLIHQNRARSQRRKPTPRQRSCCLRLYLAQRVAYREAGASWMWTPTESLIATQRCRCFQGPLKAK